MNNDKSKYWWLSPLSELAYHIHFVCARLSILSQGKLAAFKEQFTWCQANQAEIPIHEDQLQYE